MKKKSKIILWLSALLALAVTLTVYFLWPQNHFEVQVKTTERSSDGKWDAVVQMEIYNSAWVVNDAVYAVRLKGPEQRDRLGDLVMNVPVNYPDPAPSIAWNGGKLVVTLANDEKYQYLVNPVSGVPIEVRQK